MPPSPHGPHLNRGIDTKGPFQFWGLNQVDYLLLHPAVYIIFDAADFTFRFVFNAKNDVSILAGTVICHADDVMDKLGFVGVVLLFEVPMVVFSTTVNQLANRFVEVHNASLRHTVFFQSITERQELVQLFHNALLLGERWKGN